MSDWTAGYVTDTSYTQGYYRELAPSALSLVALASGVRAPSADAPLTYCELGFGQGLSLNINAAANPHIQFFGNDFNPAHVASARALAGDAGLRNVRFSDASFEDYARDAELPDRFDIIVLHGIYSWISPENRAHIVRFIRDRLSVGGLVFVSYNCLPGWAAAAPLRHLMYLHGRQKGGPTLGRVGPAIAFMEALEASGAAFFRANAQLKDRLEKLKPMDARYLAHEYMNDSWNLLYFSEVHREMEEARLAFVSTAHLPDKVDAITFTPEQAKILSEVPDPILRETVKDYMQNQQFRRDLFAKGPVPLNRLENQQAWLNTRFVLEAARTPDDLKLQSGLGQVALKPEVYDGLLNRFTHRSWTVRELLAEPEIAALGWPQLREALVVLAGSRRIHPALAAEGETKRRKTTDALNAAILRRSHTSGDIGYLASPVAGAGVAVHRFDQIFLNARREGAKDPVAYFKQVMAAGGERLLKNGAPIADEAELTQEVDDRRAAFETRLPLFQLLGVA